MPTTADTFATMRFLLTLLVLFASPLVWSVDSMEKEAQSLDKRLIAPCCWTSTLDQHFSPEAEEMKTEIRQKLSQGESEKQILSYFEAKYGERILSQPKTSGFNLTVWIFPGLVLLAGLSILIGFLKRQTKHSVKEEVVEVDPSDDKYRKQIDKELYRAS